MAARRSAHGKTYRQPHKSDLSDDPQFEDRLSGLAGRYPCGGKESIAEVVGNLSLHVSAMQLNLIANFIDGERDQACTQADTSKDRSESNADTRSVGAQRSQLMRWFCRLVGLALPRKGVNGVASHPRQL